MPKFAGSWRRQNNSNASSEERESLLSASALTSQAASLISEVTDMSSVMKAISMMRVPGMQRGKEKLA